MRGQKAYDQAFKSEAVTLVTDHGLTPTRVARDCGVDPQTIRRWLHELASAPAQRSASDTNSAEWARLTRDVAVLRHERAILKQAIGSCARMPH